MDTERLLLNFENYAKVLKKYFPEEGTDRFLEDYSVRLTTCPRGLTNEDGGKHGALIDHMTRVALAAKDHAALLDKKLGSNVIDKKSITRVCLVHELGKLGTPEEELYVTQESQWHRDKLGQNFKYNDNCPKMSFSHRTLWMLQHYNMMLSEAEYIAILTSQGMHFPENAFYGKVLSPIGKILHFAKSIVDLDHI